MEYNPPNTRERIAARRRLRNAKGRPRQQGSQVRPKTWRSIVQWIKSGRLVSLLIFVASMGALGYIFTSDTFEVRSVQVEGNSALNTTAVAAAAQIEGAPIWFVDNDQIAERLRQNAYIEQAQITVSLPDQATITIVERRPDVRWQIGGMQFLVDSAGMVLDVAQEPADPTVLVITDTSPNAALKPTDRVDADALALARALALRLPSELGFTPTMIGWDYGLGIYVKTESDQTVVFGKNEDLDQKLAVFAYTRNQQVAFSYLDLRSSSPFYR